MMKTPNNATLLSLVVGIALLSSCSKGGDTTVGGGNGSGGGGTASKDSNCIVTNICQVNSGAGTESSLSAFYNSKYEVTKVVVYDSVSKLKQFEAVFNYITNDSVRIDQDQYLLLDGNRRVKRFVSKSNITSPTQADNYLFDYTYNSDGYLAVKNLSINGSAKVNFSTSYNYSDGRLTGCIMTCPSAGNLKVLESTLTYNAGTIIKNWIYTFPDAMERYPFLSALNFGKRVSNPLTRVVTKIYNPTTGGLIDTWTTNYGSYKMNSQGYIMSGEATGDFQQGIAAFYGKTIFYYACH